MALQLVTAPTAEPISITEMRAHLKCHDGEQNDLITRITAAARLATEQETGRALMTQTWRKTLDEFPDAIRLDHPPIQSVSWVKYYDDEGVQQTLATTDYTVDGESEPGWIVPAYGVSWPSTRDMANAVEVQYVAGYTSAALVPEALKQWLLVYARAIYDNPSGDVTMSEHVDRLLDRHRVMRA